MVGEEDIFCTDVILESKIGDRERIKRENTQRQKDLEGHEEERLPGLTKGWFATFMKKVFAHGLECTMVVKGELFEPTLMNALHSGRNFIKIQKWRTKSSVLRRPLLPILSSSEACKITAQLASKFMS
jgi:hypothetical protein